MQNRSDPSPLNPLPWIVWALALPLIAMEVVLALGESGLAGGDAGIGWRLQAVQDFAFSPQFLQVAWGDGRWLPYEPWRMLTYLFVHPTTTSTIFAVVILLALGKMVAELFRWWAVLVIWAGSAFVGALVYAVALPAERAPLMGAFPADYGLIGAFTFLIWVRLAGTGSSQFRAFTLIGFLLGTQLLFALLFGGGYVWVAELAGFATGFLLSFVVSPGGLSRVRERLRSR